MIEILPIKFLREDDATIFGKLNVALATLQRVSLPVAHGIVVSPPNLKLKVTMEHYDFGTNEIFEQSLSFVKKEINSIPVPEILEKEVGKFKKFFFNGEQINGVKNLWLSLLNTWLEQIKQRLWRDGFYKGITEGLEPQVVIFVKKVEGFGAGYFDTIQDDTVINVRMGKIHPNDLKKLDELIRDANKKLFIPHEYEWVVDGGVKLTKVLPFTPLPVIPAKAGIHTNNYLWIPYQVRDDKGTKDNKKTSAIRVFLDVSKGLVVEGDVDGIYIASEKIFDLNKPRDSFEDLVFKLVETAATFPNSPILFKFADKSEGMGKVRGTLRLLHQKSLFDPMIDALDFVRNKKGYINVHPVVPFVRGVSEFLQIKRDLAVKKFGRKNSLKLWMEIAVPENIVNLEDYLIAGLDGVVLNLDELISHFSGFDLEHEELTFYKKEVSGLLKFLEDGIKLLHKSNIPFITYGSLNLYPEVLEFLVERGVYGIVIERYEAQSAHELLHQAEKRMILRRAQ